MYTKRYNSTNKNAVNIHLAPREQRELFVLLSYTISSSAEEEIEHFLVALYGNQTEIGERI